METIARVVCCLLLAVSSCESYQTDPPQLFLNSPTHCGKVYNVTNTSVYHVSKTNVKRSFSPCDLIFTSIDPTDRVCLFKRELNLITCNSVKITLYHGHVGVDSPREYTLDCQVSLSGAEWCSRRRPSLSLSMAADGPYPSMRDVDVDLLVYSKQSVHRHVSMDTDRVCGDEFDLQRSRINVTNIDPLHSKTKSTNSRPKKTCEIMFRYEGAKNNTFLCVEFHSVRAANPLCTTPNYTLQILINRANNTKDLVGVRSCQNPEPLKWCSNSTDITLRLLRHGTPEAEEDEVVFYALVLDQAGPFFDCFFCTTTTAEPKVSTATTARGSDTSSASLDETTGTDAATDTNTLAIGLGAAGGVVGLAIVLPLGLLWCRKRSHANNDNNPKASATPTATNDKPTANATTAVTNAPLTAETAGESSSKSDGDSTGTAWETSEVDEMTEASIVDNTSPVV